MLAIAAASCGKAESGHDKASEPGAQRTMLSEGYSLLYSDATHIDRVELALYVKFDSAEFNGLVTAVSAQGEAVEKDLERIAREYPAVRIDLQPLPEMETRKRSAIAKDRIIRFAPLGGHSRQEYERTVLIGLSGALNHESHLCRVMAEEEPDPGLKKFLLTSEKRYGDLYDRVMGLLDREYFKADAKP